MPKRRTSVALAALALFGLCIFGKVTGTAVAKTPDEVRAACRAEGRPCVGLVLSGGGARGFAHVGVIRVLEELGVKIDVIAGTSMGSMVGGAYAAGFTLPELEDTVLGVDWDRMLGPRPDRQLVNWRRKLDDFLLADLKCRARGRRCCRQLLFRPKNSNFSLHEKLRPSIWFGTSRGFRFPLLRLQPIW